MITHSKDERIIKRIINEQKENLPRGAWYHGIAEIIKKYKIEEKAEEVQKST